MKRELLEIGEFIKASINLSRMLRYAKWLIKLNKCFGIPKDIL